MTFFESSSRNTDSLRRQPYLACFDVMLVDLSPVEARRSVTLELKHPNVCVNLDRCVAIADPLA